MIGTVRVGDLPVERAGELLTLQRAAYVAEAQRYGDLLLPPLLETLDELRSVLAEAICLGAWRDDRLAGSVRATIRDGVMHIARLVVAPDLQGLGLGRLLLAEIEARGTGVDQFALFTGHLSTRNLGLYRRNGYRETSRETVNATTTLVHLVKPAR
jgi:ribosomal protein S18 acetylase RimI-like enzyme